MTENSKLRVFEAFAGVGSQRMALRNLGIEHEVVAIAEIDRFAIASYEAIHGSTVNLGDISQIATEDIPDHDLFTYSFPCQDISVAGKQGGLDEGSGTRSGLLWECQKVISVKKPKYLLLENVKNLVGKKHRENFDKWLQWLEQQGYSNYWQVLNAKDYCIPQNRERVFVVSILGEHEPYVFPDKQELQLRLKDMLETEVDEKFYLSAEKVKNLAVKESSVHADATKIVQVGNYSTTGGFGGNPQNSRVYAEGGISPALNTMQGGDRQPKIIVETVSLPVTKRVSSVNTEELVQLMRASKSNVGTSNKQISDKLGIPMTKVEHWFRTDSSFAVPDPSVWLELKDLLKINDDKFDSQIMEFETVDGVYDQSNRVYDPEGISATLTTTLTPAIKIKNATKQGYLEAVDSADSGQTLQTGDSVGTLTDFRIRKLTPLECWRLMGFTDTDFLLAQSVNSNSQLYKQAGNSIVVPVLEAIFAQLFIKEEQ